MWFRSSKKDSAAASTFWRRPAVRRRRYIAKRSGNRTASMTAASSPLSSVSATSISVTAPARADRVAPVRPYRSVAASTLSWRRSLMDASSGFSCPPRSCCRRLRLRHALRASPGRDAALLHEGSTATAAPRMSSPVMLADRTARERGSAMPLSYKRSAAPNQNSHGVWNRLFASSILPAARYAPARWSREVRVRGSWVPRIRMQASRFCPNRRMASSSLPASR